MIDRFISSVVLTDNHSLADMETDECLHNNGGCWRDDKTNITACRV